MAYDYGLAIGKPASETLDLPITELLGYYGYLRAKDKFLNG